jgi:hypothetical protein
LHGEYFPVALNEGLHKGIGGEQILSQQWLTIVGLTHHSGEWNINVVHNHPTSLAMSNGFLSGQFNRKIGRRIRIRH